MEKENIVSIWLGNMETNTELLDYTTETYMEDGDYIPSQFCKDFFNGDEPYEYDNLERCVAKSPSSDLKSLLKGCSYEQSIICSIDKSALDKSYNTVILVFDFEYKGENKQTNLPVQFNRAVPYEKNDYQIK